jgi:hypothetical protein
MYAAHLAAGLAIKAAEPKAPAWAVLTAAFLPDLFWIGCAAVGAEPANSTMFFDGWSHSVMSILIQAAAFALCFHKLGRAVMLAVGFAVLSHLLLDMPIHPVPLELWPHSGLALGHPSWSWGEAQFALHKTRYWWVQLTVIIPLLGFYCLRARRQLNANLIAASCLTVVGLHLVF